MILFYGKYGKLLIVNFLCFSDSSENDYPFDPLFLHPYNHSYFDRYNKDRNLEQTSKHILTIVINASSSGSWGAGQDVWDSIDIYSKSADYVASKLEIPGFTGDLSFKYVLAYLQPTLENNGDRPLKHLIDGLKAKGVIPIKPQQHLWYDFWNYT